MEQVKRIGVDTSKHVFTLHAADDRGQMVFRRNLSRSGFEAFMAKHPPVEVVLEACGASHHWARTLQPMGHQVRLIPPQYVKPFVKRSKTDRADAQAICVAAAQPGTTSVPVKTLEQQGRQALLRVRELLSKQQTQLVNALRGHAGEYGLVVGRGVERVDKLQALIEQAPPEVVPEEGRQALGHLAAALERRREEIEQVQAQLKVLHQADPRSQALTAIPGVGPIIAISLTLGVEMTQFRSGRHFAAWLGLTPKEHSTGGKQRLGGITRAGNERLRQLLVVGATAVIRHAKPGSRSASPWLLQLLERKPRKLAAVALANKMARIVWAMMTRGEAYRAPGQAAQAAGQMMAAVA